MYISIISEDCILGYNMILNCVINVINVYLMYISIRLYNRL